MKKFAKILVFVVIGIVILISAGLTYIKVALPNVGDAPALTVQATPERLERGKYLANHVTLCIDCHSTRQWNQFAGPLDTTSLGTGGETFDQSMGFPGSFHAPNITPFSLKNWTDGELYRTITTGVTKTNRALFPVMPYSYYGRMTDEDIYSIMVYIRSLPAIASHPQASVADFPMSFILNTIPKKGSPATSIPAKSDSVAYGGYVANAAACNECHTPQDKGAPIKGLEFAGGFAFRFPGGTTYSANITPDKHTGIGSWTKAQFIARFKSYERPAFKAPIVGKNDFQTVMPWTMYAGMTEEDLGALYTYLRTLKPVEHTVTKFVAQAN